MSKRSIILASTALAVIAIAVGVVVLWPKGSEPVPQAVQAPVESSPPPTATRTDPAEVFQRAFWKRPADADKILHAERREWADSEGISKWQWFLVVEPSPDLLTYLVKENAFNLPSCPTPEPPAGSPAWFKYDPSRMETLGSARAGLRFSFDKATRLLYAADSGGGFQAGAPDPAKVVPAALSGTGRLPATSPPQQRKP